jgi:hypothetical protein
MRCSNWSPGSAGAPSAETVEGPRLSASVGHALAARRAFLTGCVERPERADHQYAIAIGVRRTAWAEHRSHGPCRRWSSNSRANTRSALATNRVAPSGNWQAPRPARELLQRRSLWAVVAAVPRAIREVSATGHAEPPSAVTRDQTEVRERLDVLDERRPTTHSTLKRPRAEGGLGLAAVDRVDECRFVAGDEPVVDCEQLEPDAIAQARSASLRDCLRQADGDRVVSGGEGDDRLARPDRSISCAGGRPRRSGSGPSTSRWERRSATSPSATPVSRRGSRLMVWRPGSR